MNRRSHRIWLFSGVLSLLLALLLTMEGRTLQAALSDCVGKPYGSPGCPTRPATSAAASSSGINQCGNAILDPGEKCDQGRFNGKGGCNLDCTEPACGNGELERNNVNVNNGKGEECEPKTAEYYVLDKNNNLTTEIRFEEGPQCDWMCEPPKCDEDGDCTGGCTLRYTGTACASSENASTAAATASTSGASTAAASSGGPRCGDGTVQAPEECDDGNTVDTDQCTNACKKPVCGDKIVQAGEDCDDGNTDDNDACLKSCKQPKCGDGIRQGKEECDDGNQDSADRCTTICTLPRCGDGIVQSHEDCDAGVKNSDTQGGSCRTNCTLPACGDAVIDPGEQCDSGIRNSDTAPNACRSTCRLPSCGDGVKDTVEECDDGNRSDTDICTNSCRSAVCGDGILQNGEQCDWGNRNSATQADACRASCTLPRCGDGVTDTGEQCDEGESCTQYCTLVAAPPVPGELAAGSGALRTAAPVPSAHGPSGSQLIVIGGITTSVLLLILLFLQRLLRFFWNRTWKSIDDIPLDQIEMPWHKW